MTELELKILNYIKENPNCRWEAITRAFGVKRFDKEYLKASSHLEKLGFIEPLGHVNYENMEIYLTYNLKNA